MCVWYLQICERREVMKNVLWKKGKAVVKQPPELSTERDERSRGNALVLMFSIIPIERGQPPNTPDPPTRFERTRAMMKSLLGRAGCPRDRFKDAQRENTSDCPLERASR